MLVGAFSYADDVTLLAPTNMTLKAMFNTCTEFAASHNLLFNVSKTKCMYFNGPRSQAHGVVEFMGTAIDFVDRAELLGVSICCDVKDRNINGSVQKFYCKVNSVLHDFKDIPCHVKTRLLDTYCLDYTGHNYGTTVNMMLISFMLHGVKLFDDFGKFLIRHTAIYYRRSTRLNQ